MPATRPTQWSLRNDQKRSNIFGCIFERLCEDGATLRNEKSHFSTVNSRTFSHFLAHSGPSLLSWLLVDHMPCWDNICFDKVHFTFVCPSIWVSVHLSVYPFSMYMHACVVCVPVLSRQHCKEVRREEVHPSEEYLE